MKKRYIVVFAVVICGVITTGMPAVWAVEAFEDLPQMEELGIVDVENTESEAAIETAEPAPVEAEVPAVETDIGVTDTFGEVEPEEPSPAIEVLKIYEIEKELLAQQKRIEARRLAEAGENPCFRADFLRVGWHVVLAGGS